MMTMRARDESDLREFMTRWKTAARSEQANSRLFLAELCDVLDLPRPEPARPVNEDNAYSYERKVFVPRGDGTSETKLLDLYRNGCFVLVTKQGPDQHPMRVAGVAGHTSSAAVTRETRTWEDAMQRAKRQAENVTRCLPEGEGRPPFLIVVDVGFCFDLYTEFGCTGGSYLHFPDARRHRIMFDDLANPDVRSLFRAIWTDPLSLDPSLRSAKVMEEVASHLAKLARVMEDGGQDPTLVGQFLMRYAFTRFAQLGMCADDVSMIGTASLPDTQSALWREEYSAILLEAAQLDWKDVEPAILGTLLERALNPKERHKLGAHYTPRAYVDRLVIPTVIAPLRQDWDDVQSTASLLFHQGKAEAARKVIGGFHERLGATRVLDPACGSGNFLYVAMEHMMRLEEEVRQVLASYGGEPGHVRIGPHHFLGLEINHRAAYMAELVLCIGYMQWQLRVHGHASPSIPTADALTSIQCRDALIEYEKSELAVDEHGRPLSRWDGETYRVDGITGRKEPDETAVVVDRIYEGVAAAKWPDADFVVGNPPFGGDKRMRLVWGTGYANAVRRTYAELPEACDFVMYWWHKAAELTRSGKIRRFGFITTNSITQVFNRRVVAKHTAAKNPLHLVFAVPDHPWVDSAEGAGVRIAMTVAESGAGEGVLARIVKQETGGTVDRPIAMTESRGVIHANLRQGVNLLCAESLLACQGMSCVGMSLHARGLVVSRTEAEALGLGRVAGLENHIRAISNGRDIMEVPRGRMAIDLFGLGIGEVRHRFPEVYQWLRTKVKPERDAKAGQTRCYAAYAKKWWLPGKPRETFRPALAGLDRYIVTPMTTKHRVFAFLPAGNLADQALVAIASADAYHLGVLSSKVHVSWALAAGGTLVDCPRYNKTVCFDTFPFPIVTPEKQACIRKLGEALDAHRKAHQASHPNLTLTGMYTVLEALRAGRECTEKENAIQEMGEVNTLLKLHQELDDAVAEAYGWPAALDDEEILARLVELNAERVIEERQGNVRWLRPEYQTKAWGECLPEAAAGCVTALVDDEI